MIKFDSITKSYKSPKGRSTIFKDLSFEVPTDKNVALIGRNGAGKSTLMKMLAGLDVPDKGKILSDVRLSWPVGLAGGFQGSLTGRQNCRFVCRVQGISETQIKERVAFVEDFAEIGSYFDQPVKTYSSGMRARVAFGLSLAFDFDYYLVDEAMSVGDAHFNKKATDAFRGKMARGNIILVTHVMSQVRKLCDCVLLIRDGQVIYFDSVEDGIAAYKS